jgi:hypothetical protein
MFAQTVELAKVTLRAHEISEGSYPAGDEDGEPGVWTEEALIKAGCPTDLYPLLADALIHREPQTLAWARGVVAKAQ